MDLGRGRDDSLNFIETSYGYSYMIKSYLFGNNFFQLKHTQVHDYLVSVIVQHTG